MWRVHFLIWTILCDKYNIQCDKHELVLLLNLGYVYYILGYTPCIPLHEIKFYLINEKNISTKSHQFQSCALIDSTTQRGQPLIIHVNYCPEIFPDCSNHLLAHYQKIFYFLLMLISHINKEFNIYGPKTTSRWAGFYTFWYCAIYHTHHMIPYTQKL